MPRKSKTVQQKAASIAKARASRHPSQISDSVSVPDPEMNNTTTPETSPSPGLEIQCVAIIRAVVCFEKLLKRTIFVGISHGIPNGSRHGAQIGTKAY